MRRYLKRLIALLAILSFAGCAHVVSQEMRDRAEPNLDTARFFADPEAYSGKIVILGGIIASSRNAKDGTYIEVLQKPLNYRGIPEDSDLSYGRFIVFYEGFLDPAVYSQGKIMTAAGEVIGIRTGNLGEMQYRYPLIKGKEVHLIERGGEHPSVSFGIGIFKGF